MATYITTLDNLNLTADEREQTWFEKDAKFIPADRKAEALRCWLIARRVAEQWHLNIRWQEFGGKSDAQIVALLDARIAQHQRSAGARALKRKYGEDEAAKIIRKHK